MLSAVMLCVPLTLLRLVSLSRLVLMSVVSPILLCYGVVADVAGVRVAVVRYIAHIVYFAGVVIVLIRVIDVYRCCRRYCCVVGLLVRCTCSSYCYCW